MSVSYLIGLAIQWRSPEQGEPKEDKSKEGDEPERVGPYAFPGHAVAYSGTSDRSENYSRFKLNTAYGFEYFPADHQAACERWVEAERELNREFSFDEWFIQPRNSMRSTAKVVDEETEIEFRKGAEQSVFEILKAHADIDKPGAKPPPRYCLLVAESWYDNCLSWALARVEPWVCKSSFPIDDKDRHSLGEFARVMGLLSRERRPCCPSFKW